LNSVVCYIGVGSNLGDALRNCKQAVEEISRTDGISISAVSPFYSTEPVGYEDQNYFVNGALEIKTILPARAILQILQQIETGMGRTRGEKGSPRIIDLDILFYGQEIIRENGLSVPHPEMHRRRFVLEPLSQIASYFIHPVFGVSVRGLKERVNDTKYVEIIKE